jgi:hypothetical protein
MAEGTRASRRGSAQHLRQFGYGEGDPGALAPLTLDESAGTYVEPNCNRLSRANMLNLPKGPNKAFLWAAIAVRCIYRRGVMARNTLRSI